MVALAGRSPQLAALVDAALDANHDLAIAEARLREARALRRAAASRFRPQVGASATAQSFRLSENAPGAASALAQQGLADLTGDFYEAGFDAGWEIDVFGGVRRGVEAADAQVEAVAAIRHGVRVTVVGEVARHYVELRGAQRRLAVAERNLELLEQTHEQVRRKASVGLASDLDASRARAQLEATRASVPPLRASSTLGRLSAVGAIGTPAGHTARRPARRSGSAREPARGERHGSRGLPSDLLRRRPDLIAAERRLHASTAGIGVATADLYPRVFLTGRAGTESGSFSDLLESASRATSFGPSVRWSVFQGGRIRARIEAAEARRDVARLHFEQALLVALEDVERALVGYAETRTSRDRLADAVASASRSAELALKLYDLGLGEYLDVLDAERTLVDLEDGLVGGRHRGGAAPRVALQGAWEEAGIPWGSDPVQRLVRFWRNLGADPVARADGASRQNDAHDARLAHQVAFVVGVENRLAQSLLDGVELRAGIAQAGQLEDGVVAQTQLRAHRQRQQVDAASGHVLAHHRRVDVEAPTAQLVVQFGVNQVNLAQVGLVWILAHPRSMFHASAAVGVALHAESFQQDDLVAGVLRWRVVGLLGDGGHGGGGGDGGGGRCVAHGAKPTSSPSNPEDARSNPSDAT